MYDVAYTITGVVATEPVNKMSKGDEFRPPEPVCCFVLYQLEEDAEKRLVDSGRRISIGYYSPAETSMRPGDIVQVNTGPIYARPYERNGQVVSRGVV